MSNLIPTSPIIDNIQQDSEECIKRIRNTFGDPDLEYHYQHQFGQHDIGTS